MTFTEDTVNCDGTQSDIISTTQCSVPITTLLTAPYSLNHLDSIYAVVVANNVKGSSPASDAGNGAIIITVPDKPINLSEDSLLRTLTDLGITWTEGASNGGSVVIDYRVSMAE